LPECCGECDFRLERSGIDSYTQKAAPFKAIDLLSNKAAFRAEGHNDFVGVGATVPQHHLVDGCLGVGVEEQLARRGREQTGCLFFEEGNKSTKDMHLRNPSLGTLLAPKMNVLSEAFRFEARGRKVAFLYFPRIDETETAHPE
jgi:hypothetical protein